MTWWRSQLNPEGLSQGDVIEPVPVAVPVVPPTRLKRTTAKGDAEVWRATTDEEQRHWLFTGQAAYVLVVSHSCDLDKNEKKGRVLVAATRRLDDLDDATRSRVLAQGRRSLMPLPAIPELGDY